MAVFSVQDAQSALFLPVENFPRSRLQYQYGPPAQALYLLYKGVDPFRLLTVFAATFPKGTAFVLAGNFAVSP